MLCVTKKDEVISVCVNMHLKRKYWQYWCQYYTSNRHMIIHRLFFLYIFFSHQSVHILINDKHEIKLEMVIYVIRILYLCIFHWYLSQRVDIIVRESMRNTCSEAQTVYRRWMLLMRLNDWSDTSCLVLFVFKTTNDEWEWIWHSPATAWFMIDFHSYTGMSNSFYTYSSLCFQWAGSANLPFPTVLRTLTTHLICQIS